MVCFNSGSVKFVFDLFVIFKMPKSIPRTDLFDIPSPHPNPGQSGNPQKPDFLFWTDLLLTAA